MSAWYQQRTEDTTWNMFLNLFDDAFQRCKWHDDTYLYCTVHHLNSRRNLTNLMPLYESFLLLNMFRMLSHSSSGADDCMWVYCSVSVCTGVLVRFDWSRVVSECRFEHYMHRISPYSSRTAPVHQYTPKQSSTPICSRQFLRMNVIAFETCWAIKNFHKVTSSWFNLFNLHLLICYGTILCRIAAFCTVKPMLYK
jgi:hypothetical protein